MVSALALATFACGVLIGIDDRSLDPQAADGGGIDATTSEAAVSDTGSADALVVEAGCPAACTRCNDNRCVIDCGGTDGGCAKNVVCPPGLACRVLCESEGGKPCEDLTIDCTQAKSCRIDCAGVKDICDGMKINAGSGAICLTCKGDDGACDQIQCATTSTCTRICDRGLGGACTNNTCGATCTGGAGCP